MNSTQSESRAPRQSQGFTCTCEEFLIYMTMTCFGGSCIREHVYPDITWAQSVSLFSVTSIWAVVRHCGASLIKETSVLWLHLKPALGWLNPYMHRVQGSGFRVGFRVQELRRDHDQSMHRLLYRDDIYDGPLFSGSWLLDSTVANPL